MVALQNVFCFIRLKAKAGGLLLINADLPTLMILLLVSRFFTFLMASGRDNLMVFWEYSSELKCYLVEKKWKFLGMLVPV